MDGRLTMSEHVCQSAFYQLRQHLWSMERRRCRLSVYYCNGLLYGMADSQLRRLQLV